MVDVILDKILSLKSEESFLVIADKPNQLQAHKLFERAEKITHDAKMIVMHELKRNGQEPEPEIAELMKRFDVQIYWTNKSLSHTKARRDATEKGHRIISAPGLTKDMMDRCVDINYDDMIVMNKTLRSKLIESEKIRVTSKLGTDITLSIHDTQGWPILLNEKGSWGNLPIGEVDSGIVREKTNGKIIFDGSFPEIGMIKEPIVVNVKYGIGEITSENSQSYELKDMLNNVGADAFKLAELGIGTNPKAKITGNLLEDEKVLGTCHIAFGNDLSYKGDNDVPIHLDGVIREPTIEVDGVIIMKDGDLL